MNYGVRLGLMLLIFFSINISELVVASTSLTPEQKMVSDFQKIPEYLPFCSDSNWEIDNTPGGATHEMHRYLSTEMMKLFTWIQCDDPQHLKVISRERDFSWDFRYGTKRGGGGIRNIKIIRIDPVKSLLANRTVVVHYENGPYTNLWTSYTLIRENDQWKIDDIALKGYSTEMEEILPGSKSLKTELHAAYKRAEAKYQRDQQTLKKR